MQESLISIITVCFNSEKEIAQTMKSVLDQTYINIEYLIIDGGSKDHTIDIIKTVLAKYPGKNVKFFTESDNGIYDAMNKAIHLASGTWLNFMNAGDQFASKTIIEDVLHSDIIEGHSFVYSDFIASNGVSYRKVFQHYEKGKILHQSSIYKKELHDIYGMYYVTHPYIVSDYLFFMQVPRDCFVKYNMPISVNDTSGISMQGNWMEYERISVDYMMKRIPESRFVFEVLRRYLINIIKCFLRR